MSEPKVPPNTDNPMSNGSETKAPTTEAKAQTLPKPESKGFSNPALEMMGIKRIKLPSRNWMIFWTVLGTLGGGIAYDKYQQKKIRVKYVAQARKFGDEFFQPDQLPRKLRIYVVPPPNDYLSEGLKYLRKFSKPILNSAGLDFEIFTEERQGDIRFAVAEEIRKIRRKKAGLPEVEPVVEPENPVKEEAEKKDGLNYKNFKGLTPISMPTMPKLDEEGEQEQTIAVKDLYNPSDVLGITAFNKDLKTKKMIKEDSLVTDPKNAGGIVCIGRGAYKEYLTGIHEGLLGPLYKPKEDNETKKIEELKEDEKNHDDEDSEADKLRKENLRPYILPSEYPSATLAPELDFENLRDPDDKTPYFFVQPILVLRNWNTSGFTKQPERLKRWYTKRYQMIEYNEKLWGLINKNYRPFQNEDLDLAKGEEGDWPNSWVKTGIEKNSEWFREFLIDERIKGMLSVYEEVKK